MDVWCYDVVCVRSNTIASVQVGHCEGKEKEESEDEGEEEDKADEADDAELTTLELLQSHCGVEEKGGYCQTMRARNVSMTREMPTSSTDTSALSASTRSASMHSLASATGDPTLKVHHTCHLI